MGLIGKFYNKTMGGGFKSLGAGLSSGSLSNPKVWKGMGLISMGVLGTTAMFRSITGTRDRLQRRRGMDRYNTQL